MKTSVAMVRADPALAPLAGAEEIPARDIDAIYEFLTENERVEFERQKEYMTKGPGRIEAIIDGEMKKLYANM